MPACRPRPSYSRRSSGKSIASICRASDSRCGGSSLSQKASRCSWPCGRRISRSCSRIILLPVGCAPSTSHCWSLCPSGPFYAGTIGGVKLPPLPTGRPWVSIIVAFQPRCPTEVSPQGDRIMYCRRIPLVLVLLAAVSIVAATAAWADEGMWLFNQPPRKVLKERYDFDAHRRLAGPLAAVGRPLQQRRLGVVRLGRRAGDDQPSHRRRARCRSSARRATTCCSRATTPAPPPRNSSAPTWS